MFRDARVGPCLVRDIRANILDLGTLKPELAAAEPEIVMHLAAQPLVRASYDDPVGTFADNVMGTAHVLEAVRQASGVRAVVIVTTDKCYENREWVWGYREGDRLGGRDPYSSSKAAAELITQSYRDSFFPTGRFPEHRVAVATARAGNAIGGGDWADDRLIPDAVRAMRRTAELEIRYPGATRPWQHLLDPLSGYMLLAERLCADGAAFAEAWNFGPDAASERTVHEVLEALSGHWPGLRWNRASGAHPHEAGFLKLDCAKSRARLNWHPRIDFETAIAWTADWYAHQEAGGDMRDATERQITQFIGMERHAA